MTQPPKNPMVAAIRDGRVAAAEPALIDMARRVGGMIADGPAQLALSLTDEQAAGCWRELRGQRLAPDLAPNVDRLPYLWVDYPSQRPAAIEPVPGSDLHFAVAPSRIGVAMMSNLIWPPLQPALERDVVRPAAEHLTGFVFYGMPGLDVPYMAAAACLAWDEHGRFCGNAWMVLGPKNDRLDQQVADLGAPGPVMVAGLGFHLWGRKQP